MDPPVDEDAILHGMLDGDSAEPQPVTNILASTAARNALRKSNASKSSSQSSMHRTRSTFAGSSASLGGSNSSRNSVVSIDQSTMLVGIDDLGLQGTAAAPAAPASGGGMRYRKPLQSGNDDDVSPLPSRLARTSTRSSTNLLSDDGMAPLSSARRGSSTNSTNRLSSRTNLRSTSDLAATGTGSPRAVGSLRRMSRDPGALGSTARLTGGVALGSTTRLADASAPRRGSVGNLLGGGDSAKAPLSSRKPSIATSSTALSKARTKSSGTLLGSMTSVCNGAGAASTPPAPRKDAKVCMSNIDAALLDAERNFRTPLVTGNGSPTPSAPPMPISARSSLHSALPSVGPGRTSITSSAASQRPGMLPPLPGVGEGVQQQQQQQQAAVASDVSPAPRRFSRITSGAPITAALLHEAATQRKDTVRSVTNRLTDPDRYPDAFKHRIEAIHQRKLSVIQHQHELEPDDKLTPADLGAALPPMDHISDRAAAVTDRLYRPTPAPAPPTAPAPARARPKPRHDANRGMDFFNEFARGASRIQDVPAAAGAAADQTGPKHEEAAGDGAPLAGIFGDVPLKEGGIKKVTAMSMGNLTVIK